MASNKALSYTVKLLSIRDYFTEELRAKVARKFGEEESDQAIATVKSYGYLDDNRAAESYIRSKLLKGYGPYYICGKLYERGFHATESDVSDIAVKENINMEDYIKLLAAKYIDEENSDPYKAYVKCMTFLRNRGYSIHLCNKIVKKGDFE